VSHVNEILGIFCRRCDSLLKSKREMLLSGNRALDEIMNSIDQKNLCKRITLYINIRRDRRISKNE